MFLKELMSIRQGNQRRFFTIGIHDTLMMCMRLGDIAILNIRGADDCCIINGSCKSEAINLMRNIDLIEKCRIKHLLSYEEMGKEILTLGDIETEKIFYHYKIPNF